MSKKATQKPERKVTGACQFCKPVLTTVYDYQGKDTGKKHVQHDITVPHPTVFAVGESTKYFK